MNILKSINKNIIEDGYLIGIQKNRLFDSFGYPSVRTNFPVAYESPDHIEPWGTANDNSKNKRFTAKLINLLGAPRVSVLDLGCSGGGQVRDFIENGYFAVGIEGSDVSLRRVRAEWLTIPEFLFTADITKPFKVSTTSKEDGFKFAAITMWEVIEHIREDDLPALMSNLDAHLQPNGVIIMSVSPNEEIINGVRLHQTVHEKDWWLETFAKMGWQNHEAAILYFGTDLVRCNTQEGAAPRSFHVALTRKGEAISISDKAKPLLA